MSSDYEKALLQLAKLTDAELRRLERDLVLEQDRRGRASDLERRRAAIRRGEGDPGPGFLPRS